MINLHLNIMNTKIQISFPTDENGYTGRECPSCEQYFKVKFGTGLPTSQHICPYCGYKDEADKFFTQDQVKYLESIIAKSFVEPLIKDFSKSLKRLETKNSFIQIKIKTTPHRFTIKHYQEKILQTDIICDNCGLDFSIYGVFSNCPDCGQLNAKVVFEKSIESSIKKINLCNDINIDKLLKNELQKDALISGVSAFDALGKALKVKHDQIIPSKPRNLFQNIDALNDFLHTTFGKQIADYISEEDFNFLFKMFQVRHIYEHNAGVIDNDFIKKIPEYSMSKGRIYTLADKEIIKFLHIVQSLGTQIFYEFE